MKQVVSLALLVLIAMAVLAHAAVQNLGEPLPPALGGRFGKLNSLSFSNQVADGNMTCNVTYVGGAVTVPQTTELETVVVLNADCHINGTVVFPNETVGNIVNGRALLSLSGSVTTVACGNSFQIGMSYGVIGGEFESTLNGEVQATLPLCLYFTRISASSTSLATLNLALYPGTMQGNQVGCPESRPVSTQELYAFSDLQCEGGFNQAFNCINSPQSRCTSYNKYESDIGIGMSVGGIGLLLVTLGCILIIQKLNKA